MHIMGICQAIRTMKKDFKAPEVRRPLPVTRLQTVELTVNGVAHLSDGGRVT